MHDYIIFKMPGFSKGYDSKYLSFPPPLILEI